ncbi:MAG TPA: LysM peptidoglycan-binding domain-containing protein [Bacillota bacterium]
MTAKKAKIFLSLMITGGLLASFSTSISAGSYQVKPGDSLYKISKAFGTSISSIQSVNQLWSSTIYPGQILIIPETGQSGSAKYTVKSGDTLYLIAQRFNVTVSQLRSANGIWNDYLWVGQTLYIPKSTSGSSGSGQDYYTVRSGDSLYLIANRFGTSINAIKSANNLYNNTIYPGQILRIPQTQNVPPASPSFSASDIELLARLVRAEAEGEPYEGMVAVAATVLNRVADPRYPNSIPGVIYQVVNGVPQFSPVIDGRINLPATATSRKAAQDAINGWDPSYGATGFYNPAKTTNWWVKSQPTTTRIGDHVFFKY